MPSVDSGNLKYLPFSNLCSFDELSRRSIHNVATQLQDLNHWKALHFLHINVNSLLPKIDEVKLIANKLNETIPGISKTKLDKTIMIVNFTSKAMI